MSENIDLIKVIVKPFIQVTADFFDSMIGCSIQVKSITYAGHRFRENGVYANIGFGGDMMGMVAVIFHENVAKRIIGRFLGEEEAVDAIDEDAIDAVGEIINIIAGGKSYIDGYNLKMSLPSVLFGNPMMIALPRDVPVIETVFTAQEVGEFRLLICLQLS